MNTITPDLEQDAITPVPAATSNARHIAPDPKEDATIPLVIVGGGIQGTIFSLAIATHLKQKRHLVIDPHPTPLFIWERNCRACGMQYLRSPAMHQLSSEPHSLLRFQRDQNWKDDNGLPSFIPRYKRPRLSLFMRHARELIRRHNLTQFRFQATCQHIILKKQKAIVKTDCGATFTARRVLICGGITRKTHIPNWAKEDIKIKHVFDNAFNIEDYRQARKVVIIGGGITALQLALSIIDIPRATSASSKMREIEKAAPLETQGKAREVIVISRHALRYADFDSDPCYLGPRCLKDFEAMNDTAQRERSVQEARNRGSIPPDIAMHFEAACAKNRCQLIIGEVARREQQSKTTYRLSLTNGKTITCDAVLLATGFTDAPQQTPLFRDLQQQYALPCSASGMPITDPQLRWHPRLLLCGAPASLTLGPAAGNIIGAHLALRRILPVLQNRQYHRHYAWSALTRL